jgi:diguanylate cyclase (GGDEF)-like protein
MRLATITNWAYGATVALTLISGTTMLLAGTSEGREREAVAQRAALDQATAKIEEDVELLSGLARQFAISGQPADLIAYRREAGALKAVEERTGHIRDAGASRSELDQLHEILRWADALQGQQQQAIAARQRGDDAAALGIVFSSEYARELDRSVTAVRRFQDQLDQRTDGAVHAATERSTLWRTTSEVMLGITALLFLFVLYFIFRRRVLHPVVRLSDVVGRLATQDFAAEPPVYEHIDEIGDMAQALRVFRENGIERQRLERERDADRTMRDLLSRMTQRMQGCDTVADLKGVIGRFVPEVAPHLAGRLYLLDAERNVMGEACSWLDPQHSRPEFSPLSCWALRRGAPHRATGECIDVPCEHITGGSAEVLDTLCLPLMGQAGVLGLLYLERRDIAREGELSNMYVTLLAENVGLALDNLRLRDALRAMAMVDPLTKLANRRELDRELERQLGEAERAGTVMSCAMIDIDHFKRFNDDHGHDAGDAVLREVGAALRQSVRADSSVYRYGGEEFLVLFPGLNAEDALARAEEIRETIASLSLRFDGHEIGPINASIGVATAPLHCEWRKLAQTADAALLGAKRAGRNRVLAPVVRQSAHSPHQSAA